MDTVVASLFFIVLQKGEQLSDFLFHQCRMHFEMLIDGNDDDDDDSIHSFVHKYLFYVPEARSKEGILFYYLLMLLTGIFHSTTH